MPFSKLLKNNNFLLFLLGQNMSVFGDMLLTTGFSLFVLISTQSAMQLSITLGISFIPRIILSPYAGVIVDRLPKKKLAIFLDTLRGLWLIGLYFYTLHRPIDLRTIYITLAFFSICDTFFMPAFMTIFTRITPKDQLQEGNAYMSTLRNVVSVISPLIATSLFSIFGLGVLLLLDGLTFLVSAFLEQFMMFKESLNKHKSSIIKEIKDVTHIIKGHTQLKSLLINGVLTHLFMFPFIEIFVMHILLITFQAPENHYGFLQSVISVAAILAGGLALIYSKKKSIADNINIGILGMLISVLTFELLIFKKFRDILMNSSYLPTIYLSIACFMIFISFHFYGVFFVSYYQKEMPIQYMGRYAAIKVMLFSVARLLGMLTYGYLIEKNMLRVTLALLFIGMGLKVFVHIPFLTAEKSLNQGVKKENVTT